MAHATQPTAEVVLGVTGSISAYQAADIVRRLREQGCAVTCVMTREAAQFITPLTLQAVSGRKVCTDLFSLEDPHVIHTELADHAQLLLIAPATANILAKLAHGFADDLLSCVALATKAPILIAPAMNVHMYEHPATQDNLRTLTKRGCRFVGPCKGSLACGYEAMGHVAPVDEIVTESLNILRSAPPRDPSLARSSLARSSKPLSRRR